MNRRECLSRILAVNVVPDLGVPTTKMGELLLDMIHCVNTSSDDRCIETLPGIFSVVGFHFR